MIMDINLHLKKDRSFFHNAFIDALCTAILYWKDKYGVENLKNG